MTKLCDEGEIPTVFIVEDDTAVRKSLDGLFGSIGLQTRSFETSQAFLEDARTDAPGCLVVDVRLPGMSGLDLYDELARTGDDRPVVFISGHADVAMSVRAMKAGAVEFLTKPVRHQDLLDAVQVAIEKDRRQRNEAALIACIMARMKSLTRRELEVMTLVTEGYRNKEIAAKTGVTEATVKLHRGHVMHKMEARSIAELIRMADRAAAGIGQPKN